MNDKPPIFNHRGQVANAPAPEPNPFVQFFIPMFGSCLPGVIADNPAATPAEIADKTFAIANAALARLGFNFNFKQEENQP